MQAAVRVDMDGTEAERVGAATGTVVVEVAATGTADLELVAHPAAMGVETGQSTRRQRPQHASRSELHPTH